MRLIKQLYTYSLVQYYRLRIRSVSVVLDVPAGFAAMAYPIGDGYTVVYGSGRKLC